MVGQTINAWVVVAIKARTKEKHPWARLVGSTFAGQLGDTLVFCSIAAGAIGINTFGDFLTYAALGLFYKTAVEVVMLPRHLPRDRIRQETRADLSGGALGAPATLRLR